jgi:hypothetical protein
MNDEFDPVLLGVRVDTRAFQQDVAEMQAALQASLGSGADTAGRSVSTSLARAARAGKLEFADLAKVAGKALGDIAAAALKVDVSGAGNGSGNGGGFAGLLSGVVSAALGAPGRATGGPVSPGRPYVVGEQGPELFVPTSAGRIETGGPGRGPVSVTVNMSTAAPVAPEFMARTGRQLARQVQRALDRTGN